MLVEERRSAPAIWPALMPSPPRPKPPVRLIDVAALPALYAMQCIGRCMEPEVAHGSTLVFDKWAPCRPGDIVVVIRSAEATRWPDDSVPGLVKRLIHPLPDQWDTDSEILPVLTVEMLNPRRRLHIDAASVAAVHRCLGPAVRQPDGSMGVAQAVINAARGVS
jgi:hypothetical protein